MSDDSVREQLSALMDGELSADSARFLSKRLGNDNELSATWERWHCARDALRRQVMFAPADFSANVRAALEADGKPGSAQVGGRNARRVWRGFAGAAIAAGVAAVALVFGGPGPVPDGIRTGEATLANVASVTTSDLTPNWRLSPVADRQSVVLAQAQTKNEFDRYFVEHGLTNGSAGAFGIVSYAPLVATPDTRLANAAGSEGEAAR